MYSQKRTRHNIPLLQIIILLQKKYVDDYVQDHSPGDMLKSIYDTNNDGIVDKAAHSNNADRISGKEVNDSLDTGVIWTADRIKAELDQNLPIQLLQWSGTVTSNQVIDFGIPTSEGYKTNSLEVLMRLDDGKLTKAIHAIDYGYTYRDTSHIEIRFFQCWYIHCQLWLLCVRHFNNNKN